MSSPYLPFPIDRPGPFQSPVLPSNLSFSEPISGNGPPEGVNEGVPGQTYVDILNNNDLWLKIVGTQTTGWKKIGTWTGTSGGGGGGGGGGTGNVFRSTVDPPTNLCAGPGICFGDGALQGTVWIKTTAGTNSTDWFKIIG